MYALSAAAAGSGTDEQTGAPLPEGDLAAVMDIVLGSPLNLLLLCVPLGFLSAAYGWGPVWTFFLNFAALVPLALILGDVTEDLALRCALVHVWLIPLHP